MRTAALSLVVLLLLPIGVLHADDEEAPPRTKEDRVRALLQDPGLAPDLVEILVPLYLKHLDEEALGAWLELHESAEGRRAVEAIPRILAEAISAVEARTRTRTHDFRACHSITSIPSLNRRMLQTLEGGATRV